MYKPIYILSGFEIYGSSAETPINHIEENKSNKYIPCIDALCRVLE